MILHQNLKTLFRSMIWLIVFYLHIGCHIILMAIKTVRPQHLKSMQDKTSFRMRCCKQHFKSFVNTGKAGKQLLELATLFEFMYQAHIPHESWKNCRGTWTSFLSRLLQIHCASNTVRCCRDTLHNSELFHSHDEEISNPFPHHEYQIDGQGALHSLHYILYANQVDLDPKGFSKKVHLALRSAKKTWKCIGNI